MNLNRLTLFLSLCILVAHCKSPADQTKEAFDKVDQSIKNHSAVTIKHNPPTNRLTSSLLEDLPRLAGGWTAISSEAGS